MNLESKIYLTSDCHFCHSKDFCYAPRGFKNSEEMNKTIVKNWNSVIQKHDIVYLLGDVMLGDLEKGLSYLNQLNGQIYIAIGNHDTNTKIKAYKTCDNVKSVEMGYRLKYKKRTLILTHYPTLVGNFDEFKFKTINFCGHTHTKDKFLHFEYGCYHVELDAHNNYPILLEDALNNIFKEKQRRS